MFALGCSCQCGASIGILGSLHSIGAYCLITWANRYARAGYVLAYTALQPFTSTVLSVCLILLGVKGLQMPGWNALGSIGIILGLFLLVLDGKHQHEADEESQALSIAGDAADAPESRECTRSHSA